MLLGKINEITKEKKKKLKLQGM
jgi:hypothetical protein